MTDETDREALAATYRKVADRLAIVAGQLQHLNEGPPLSPLDVGGLLVNAGVNVVCHEYDRQHAIAFLRSLAATLEATGAPKVN